MKFLILPLSLLSAPAFASCPDPAADAPSWSATGPELIAPQSWELPFGGETQVPCGEWAFDGRGAALEGGFLPVAPTAVVELSGMGPHILVARATASCEPILAARTPDGLWYFGETRDIYQEITFWGSPSGPLQVWLGAAGRDGCTGTLELETYDR